MENDEKEFRTSTDNVAAEKHFNDIEVDDLTISTEGWLSNLEAITSPILSKLKSQPAAIERLDHEEENNLARFVAALRLRTRYYRDWNRILVGSVTAEVRDSIWEQLVGSRGKEEAAKIWKGWEEAGDHPEVFGYGESDSAKSITFLLGETQGFANLLVGAPWRIGSAPANLPLYTSDNPVSGYLRPVKEWWETAAFSSLTYFFPSLLPLC